MNMRSTPAGLYGEVVPGVAPPRAPERLACPCGRPARLDSETSDLAGVAGAPGSGPARTESRLPQFPNRAGPT